jgi:sulfopyruvate decarboxylase subunit beta
MNRAGAIETIISATIDEPVLFTAGEPARIARAIADRPNHFYLTGATGLVSSIGIGVAHQTRRPTIVVDGDGSLVTNPAGLITAGLLCDLPLVHVVLDGRLQSAPQPALASRADLCAMATAAGYPRVYSTGTLAGFTDLFRREVGVCSAPVFIRCVLAEDDSSIPVRIGTDLEYHARRFYDHVSAPEWLAA